MSKAPVQIPLDRGIPGLLSLILQWAKARQDKEYPLPSASPAIQNAAYPGSSYPEGGFLSTQPVKQPETGLIFLNMFYLIFFLAREIETSM